VDSFLTLLQADGAGGTGLLQFPLMIGAIVLIFYFLIIRPQGKRTKETKSMLGALKKGDRIVSAGGVHGQVTAVKENTVTVKVDDTTKIEFSKSSISSVIPEKSPQPDSNES
jgi:preprotein translocase subunit YajC